MSRIKSLYEPFQKWQEHSNIFIISDTHFEDNDREAMGYNLSEMQQVNIINRGLEGKNSTLIHLGDVGNPEWMNKIKASRKILIMGNHDVGKSKYESYFDEIYEGMLFISPKILLSHEKYLLPFACNLHGHHHNGFIFEFNGLDEEHPVGVNLAGNVVGFKPFNLNNFINNGGVKYIPDIHRITIDNATENKALRDSGHYWVPQGE